jgi:uncharacterized protein YeaO (DUF488 family)
MIQIKRAYDPVEESDGYRILIDRLWPRGVSKEQLRHDAWLKEIAPTDELREWLDHEPDKFGEFKRQYKNELDSNDQLEKLLSICESHDSVTLIYSAKDQKHNNAVVLKEYLEKLIRDA